VHLRRRNHRRRRSPCRLLKAHRGNKIIAAPGNRDDVAAATLAIAEGAAQGANLDLEIRFVDEGLRPDPGNQLVLADNFAGAFDEGGQNIKGRVAEPQRLIALQ